MMSHFYFFTSLSVILNICYDTIGLIESLLTALETNKDLWVVSIAYNMRELFDKFWDSTEKINKMLIIVFILDL